MGPAALPRTSGFEVRDVHFSITGDLPSRRGWPDSAHRSLATTVLSTSRVIETRTQVINEMSHGTRSWAEAVAEAVLDENDEDVAAAETVATPELA
jgi:hypothetical protein